jgi:hypothetical protein
MKKVTTKFRPTNYPAKSHLRDRRLGLDRQYRWGRPRKAVRHAPLNKLVLRRIFFRLHYFACHAPDKAGRQYEQAYMNFQKVHIGFGKQSVNYSNTWVFQL